MSGAPIVLPAATPVAPKRAIFTEVDKEAFIASSTCAALLEFVTKLNLAARNRKISEFTQDRVSPAINRLTVMLASLSQWVDDIAPVEQPMRYGNKAFRGWHTALVERADALLTTALPEALHGYIIELKPYLLDSFGNATRIDYGTGHETNFIIFLLCLFKLSAFTEDDLPAVVLSVFAQYMNVCRKLQRVYRMEPAGSHGVWSLDDYHILPFVFGSSQLHDCIQFIHDVKSGAPFAEHSPMLNSISGMKTWALVNDGLMKMYMGEVLSKLPVVQHIVFGSVFACTWTPSEDVDVRLLTGVRGDVAPAPPAGFVDMGITGVAPWARAGAPAKPATSAYFM